MTVNTTKITSGPYVGNNIADTFSYTFKVEDKTQLSVYETTDQGVETLLTVDTDYTVSGIGIDSGGTILRIAGALPTEYQWFIRSDYKETQLTAFSSQGAFFPDLHENSMDKLTLLIQQILDRNDRSPRVSDTYTGTLPLTLDDPVAGKLIKWKGDLSGFENTDISELSPGLVGDDQVVFAFSTLAEAQASTDTTIIKLGAPLLIKERVTNGGNGGLWYVNSGLTANDEDIVDHDTLPLQLKQLHVENLYTVATVAALKTHYFIPGQTVKTQGYYEGWAALAKQEGSSDYIISTLENVRVALVDPAWTPDEIQDHTLNNGYIAMMLRTSEYCLDQFGVVGGADDTARLQSAFSNVGVILFNSFKTYTCKDALKLIDGTTVNLNGSKIIFECLGNVENFVIGSHTRLHNGIIQCDNDPQTTSSTIGGRAVRVAGKSSQPDGSNPELIHNWVIEDLTIYTGLIYASGELRGARAIIIRDNVSGGRVSDIRVDGRGQSSGTVYAEWGEHEFFPDPTVKTVHPRNILIENVTLRNAGVTGSASSPSMGVSGCYNITIRNIDIIGADIPLTISMGEAGRGYASDDDKKRILRGITVTNFNGIDCDTGVTLFGRGSSAHPLSDDGIPWGSVTFEECTFRGRYGTGAANKDGAFMSSFGKATFKKCSIKDFTRYGYYPLLGNTFLEIEGGDCSFNGSYGAYLIGDSTTVGEPIELPCRGRIQGVEFEGNGIDETGNMAAAIGTFYTERFAIKGNFFKWGGNQEVCVNAGSSVFASYLEITGNHVFDPEITRLWRTGRAAGSPNDETYRILVHNNFFDSATCSIEGTHVFTTDGL